MVDQTIAREKAIQFAKNFYARNRRAPSVRKVKRNLRGLGGDFYDYFPDGIQELCRAAGIPVEPERMELTSLAQKTQVATQQSSTLRLVDEIGPESGANFGQRLPPIVLNEDQSKKLYVIAYLEGGKLTPSRIIDELLASDSKRRSDFDLTFSDVANVKSFLETARSRGGWNDDVELSTAIHQIHFHRIDELDKQVVFSVIQFVTEMVKNHWNISQYVEESLRSGTALNIYRNYRLGKYSAQAAIDGIASS